MPIVILILNDDGIPHAMRRDLLLAAPVSDLDCEVRGPVQPPLREALTISTRHIVAVQIVKVSASIIVLRSGHIPTICGDLGGGDPRAEAVDLRGRLLAKGRHLRCDRFHLGCVGLVLNIWLISFIAALS